MRTLVVLSVMFASASAHALLCRPQSASDALEDFDGATVPTNLVLVARRVQDFDAVSAASLDGDSVRFDVVESDGFVRLVPERALQADTDYVIGNNGPLATSVRVRTASAPEDDAPPPPPLASVASVEGRFFEEPRCDGPTTNATIVTFDVDIVADGALVLTRVLGDDRTVIDIEPVLVDGDAPLLRDVTDEGGEATYEITALDLAGHASEPTILTQSLGCPGSCAQADAALASLVALGALARARRRR